MYKKNKYCIWYLEKIMFKIFLSVRKCMSVAMNRFKILIGKENDFENKRTHLGFQGSNNLIKGKTTDEYTCMPHIWNSEKISLTDKIENNKGNKHLYLGHPEFEVYKIMYLNEKILLFYLPIIDLRIKN